MRKSPVPVKSNARKNEIKQTAPAASGMWVYAGLVALIFAVYIQVRNFEFVTLDDLSSQWVLGALVRRGITLQGLWWALTSGDENWWFPVTRFSHMLDVELFGVNAGAAHLTSVFLHACSTLVLFSFFKRATGEIWPSAFVAFVFAMHPLHVESVAWVAERKDVLCAFFYVWTLWAYLRYTQRPDRRRYALVAIFMALALMSKSMAASLPFALMLCDYWPLRRPISVRASIREKLPLFGLAVASGIVTVITSRRGGAGVEIFPFALRVENGLIRYVLYLVKMFWPSNLAAFYPYPLAIPVWQAILAPVTLCGLTVLFVRLRRYPYLPVGWLWYLITMSLVIGIVQSGWQAWADRYMYIPMIGLSAMIAWGAAELLRRWPKSKSYIVALACASCLLMTAVAYNQIQYWKNTETLFLHALAVTDRNVMAHNSLGAYYLDMPGRLPEAIDHLEKAIAIDPRNEIAHNNLGLALLKSSGRLADARTHFETAVQLRPSYFEAHNNLAAVFLRTPGGAPNAVNEFETAVRIKPDSKDAHYNLGAALSAIPGRLPDAIAQFETALQIDPDFDGHYALGMALAQVPERRAEAVVHLRAALQLRPGSREAQQLLRQLIGSGAPSN